MVDGDVAFILRRNVPVSPTLINLQDQELR